MHEVTKEVSVIARVQENGLSLRNVLPCTKKKNRPGFLYFEIRQNEGFTTVGKGSQISQTRKLSFQIQHLEGVLSSKEEALRHAQESHEQTVNKVKRKWAAVPYDRKNMKLGNMATFKCHNPDKINQGTRVIFLLLPETNYLTL